MSEEITNTENSTSRNERAKENVSGCLKSLGMITIVAIFVILPICLCPILFSIYRDTIGSIPIDAAAFNYTGEYYTYHEAIHKHIAQTASTLQGCNLMYSIGLVLIGVLVLLLNAFTNLLVIIMSDGIGNKLESILKDKENKN